MKQTDVLITIMVYKIIGCLFIQQTYVLYAFVEFELFLVHKVWFSPHKVISFHKIFNSLFEPFPTRSSLIL